MKFVGKTPARISLCNGGDMDFYIKYMGWSNLINATLSSQGYYCEVEPQIQEHISYRYKNTFTAKDDSYTIKDLKNNGEENLRLIKETIKQVHPEFKGTIKIITNVPEKSGLGGSSSLVVALMKALMKSKGEKNILPEKIAWLAYKIERENLAIKGGYQDQWAAAFGGGVNYLEFKKNKVFLEPLWLSESLMKKLEDSLMLFFIESRKTDEGEVHKKLEKKVNKEKKESLSIMLERRNNVLKTREALLKGDIQKFAELLDKEHKSKEKLYADLLTSKAKEIYNKAHELGALAGKISGAGSGGSAIFIYSQKDKQRFIQKMQKLGCRNIPLKLQRIDAMGQI